MTIDCRHRGPLVSPGVHNCGSPKLLGLKLVTDPMCGGCHYRDHAPVPAAAELPPRLARCLYFGPPIERSNGLPAKGVFPPREVEHTCQHPQHLQTTEIACRGCPDYLFPAITPKTPPEVVQQMIDFDPRPQADQWWEWPNVQEAIRRGADGAIAQAPAYPGGYEGRGIVIAGGGAYFASAYVTIRVLRHVGCQLPIELWHMAGEVTEAMQALLQPYGVRCINADEVSPQHPFRFIEGHWWKGWQLKPYAVAHSSFREVLFLDADCYPTRDPAFLFDWPPYRERGATFWPDLRTSEWMLAPARWEVFGTRPGWLALETGQFMVNKEACWRELQLTLWYNAHADFVYHVIWGDKDTFNIAWRRLGTHYSMPQAVSDWDTHTILQYAPDGTVLFQHRCQDKFRLEPARFASTHQRRARNQHNPRLVHEDDCFGFLEELRQVTQSWGAPKPAAEQTE